LKKPIRVNGEYYNGVTAAAVEVSRLSRKKVSGIYLSRQMKRERTVVIYGITVSLEPPKPEPAAKEPVRERPPEAAREAGNGRRPPLLRHPPGESSMERGPLHTSR
jgi:hypothetical protein